jgi:Fur family peroxide stress response transcriptional regulator
LQRGKEKRKGVGMLEQGDNAAMGKATQAPPQKRNTIQRSLILEAIYELDHHPTSSDVYEQVCLKHASISRATVYRNLDILVKDKKIVRFEISQGAARYDTITEPHYHVFCDSCGRVDNIDLPNLGDLTKHVKSSNGYDVVGYQVVFKGICAGCKQKRAG